MRLGNGSVGVGVENLHWRNVSEGCHGYTGSQTTVAAHAEEGHVFVGWIAFFVFGDETIEL